MFAVVIMEFVEILPVPAPIIKKLGHQFHVLNYFHRLHPTTMKKLILFVWVLLAFGQVNAQEDTTKVERPWTKGGQGLLTFNQVGLFNWAAGGTSNMTLIANTGFFANYKKGTTTWDNSLDLAYGFLKNFYNNAPLKSNSAITKAEDKIDLNSKFGKKAWSEKVFYSALLNYRSQFAPGFAAPGDAAYISKFMAPGYLQVALGLDFKPNSKLSIFVSPLAGKFTFVLDDSLASVGAFGVNQFDDNGDRRPGSGNNARAEFGANLRVKFKDDIMQNVGYETQLDLFSNYIDRPGNVDIRWTNNFLAKVNKYLAVTFFTDLIYDNDILIGLVGNDGLPSYSIDPTTGNPYIDANGNPVQRKGRRIQLKEIFGVGLTYKFSK